MDLDYTLYANAVGDSFIDKCFAYTPLMQFLAPSYTPLLGWSEPYPLLFLNLILLMILPTVFRYGSKTSFLKISRLYTFARLGLLSLLHQIGYSYTVAVPLSMLFRQPSPCTSIYRSISIFDYSLPSSLIMSASILVFAVQNLANSRRIASKIVILVFLFLISFFGVAAQFCSVFQATFSVLLAYILHFSHLYVPFKYMWVENGVLLIANIVSSIYLLSSGYFFRQVFFLQWFCFVVIIIDQMLLFRHQMTRGGFPTVERAADLQWSTETPHNETMRLLSSEEEEKFYIHIQKDTTTSFIAFIMLFIGVLSRRFVSPDNFFEGS